MPDAKEPRPPAAVLYGLTLVLASCSIVYELLLAQTLSATMGNTFLRYNITIGLYLASLGAGALWSARVKRADWVSAIVDVELALALLGALGPWLVMAWDKAMHEAVGALGLSFRGTLHQALVYGFNHFLIVAIGALSGFELPMMMRWGSELSPDRSNQVLAMDYAGTLVGAMAFPFLLLPHLGVLITGALAALANALAGLYILTHFGGPGRRVPAYVGAAALCLGMLISSAWLERAVLHRIYYF